MQWFLIAMQSCCKSCSQCNDFMFNNISCVYICSFGSINIRILTAVLGMSNLLSFSSKIASRGYHVYMNTTWQNAFVGERVWVQIENNLTSKQIDPYCCAVNINSGGSLVTVGHVPREISRFVYFFIRDEGGNVEGTLLSTRYRPSPIPAGGLEVPLKLEDEMEDGINIDIVVESGETKNEGDDDDQKYDNEHGSGDNDDDEQDNDEENEEENDSSESDIGNNNSKPKKRRYYN